jgi:isoleucyl-tRNA synthetase
MAPVLPHLTEYCHQLLRQFNSQVAASVHLEAFPEDSKWRNSELEAAMEKVRLLAALGRNARAKKGLKLRQPLAKAYVLGLEDGSLTKELMDVLTSELNVKEVFLSRKEEFPKTELVVVEEQKLTLALDTTITPVLKAEGIVRDAVRVVQQLRKSLDLILDEQITVTVCAKNPEVFAALEAHRDYFMHETQAAALAQRRSFAEARPFFRLGPGKLDSQWVVQKAAQSS